jgi:hypothetical protein
MRYAILVALRLSKLDCILNLTLVYCKLVINIIIFFGILQKAIANLQYGLKLTIAILYSMEFCQKSTSYFVVLTQIIYFCLEFYRILQKSNR